MKKWNSSPAHNKIFKQLFSGFDSSKKYQILDAGSGRTSLSFLAKQFPKSEILAIIYPGDERKSSGISESVRADNFVLQEADLHQFKQKTRFDIVLAHLLLGEATKFSKKPFEKMVKSLFNIKTDYLVIVDILEDKDVDYKILSKYVEKYGTIEKRVTEDKYIGFLVKK